MAAMAGMYLGGAATFVSFATGTILVVAIAMIGSLTVLPLCCRSSRPRQQGPAAVPAARAAHRRAARLVVGARPRAQRPSSQSWPPARCS